VPSKVPGGVHLVFTGPICLSWIPCAALLFKVLVPFYDLLHNGGILVVVVALPPFPGLTFPDTARNLFKTDADSSPFPIDEPQGVAPRIVAAPKIVVISF